MNAPTEPISRRNAHAAPRAIRTSLGLAGDGDEMDLLADIERVFAIKLADRELRDARTVGDLDEVIWRRIGRAYAGNKRSMGAMAFYALRRILRTGNGDIRIAPATPLKAFAMPPKVLAAALEKREGLQMRFDIGLLARLGWLAQAGWLVLLWALLFGPFDWAMPSLIAVIAGMAAIGVDRGGYARGDRVGDLAKRLAYHNFGALAAMGGRADRESVWAVVRRVAADLQRIHPDEIGRGTVLLAKPRPNAKA
jgi:hypothetical protein